MALLFLSPLAHAAWTEKGGTLSADVTGWASNAAVATAPDDTLCAVWAQHQKADDPSMVSPRAARWTGNGWQALGGRIGHDNHSGFDPELVFLGATPYVAWYEGDGYGWGRLNDTFYGSSIFVSHWDGGAWVRDDNAAMANGSLHTVASIGTDGYYVNAYHPRLAVVNNRLYAAWLESRPGEYSAAGYEVVVVKHLENGAWIQDGAEFHSIAFDGAKINDMVLADIGGTPYVALSEFRRHYASGSTLTNDPGTLTVFRLAAGAWTPVGAALNTSAQGYTGFAAMASVAGVPYVSWQERTTSGKNQIYTKHWNNTAWTADGASLNVDTVAGEAGRPALTSQAGILWLAWTEGTAGQPGQLYVRSLTSSGWSAPEGSLNRDLVAGSSDHPSLATSGAVPQVLWGEYDPASRSKQIYAAGRDSLGAHVPVSLARFGNDGPAVSIPDNTWVPMNPGGIARTAWVIGDEGYDSFLYDPGIKRALVYGIYHSVATSWGENQNALLAYDFRLNRWDILESGEYTWSENLPGVGHDEGNIAIDTVHDLYISHGNLSVGTNPSRYMTYLYDLKAHRGKRMTPPQELVTGNTSASAFDPDHDRVLLVNPEGGWIYDHQANNWTTVPGTPARGSPTLVYDTKNHLYVMFGGMVPYGAPSSTETWVFDGQAWSLRLPAVSPPHYDYPQPPFMAYDSLNGVTLLMGGNSRAVWVYDAAANTWSRIADLPAGVPVDQVDGLYLTYDSDDHVFLVRASADIANLWAFRYAPSGGSPPETVPTPSITPYGGANLTPPQTVTLACDNPAAQIYYTTDGSTPNQGNTGTLLYSGPLSLSNYAILKARAYAAGFNSSAVAGPAVFLFASPPGTVATPVFDPPGGDFTGSVLVQILETTPSAEIRYTTDLTVPNASSPLYTRAVALNRTTTLKAIGIAGSLSSQVSTAVFTESSGSGSNPQPVNTTGSLLTVKVFPNPWRKDQHASRSMTFDGLVTGTTIKIFTASGHNVQEIKTDGPRVDWNLTNTSGDKVASGVYLYVITDTAGDKVKGKVAVIK